MTDIPALNTDRLVLRAPTHADWPTDLAFNQSNATRFTGGRYDDKTASKRVAEKLGATWDGAMAAHDPRCEIWCHPVQKETLQ